MIVIMVVFVIRFNEYECGAWYARAMASYAMLEGLTGIRYDAVDKIFVYRFADWR